MRISEPLAFSVQHMGRGGSVIGQSQAGELRLALELQSDGVFCVWLRAARLVASGVKERRLTAVERRLVGEQLRAWLDSSGRTSWSIEPEPYAPVQRTIAPPGRAASTLRVQPGRA